MILYKSVYSTYQQRIVVYAFLSNKDVEEVSKNHRSPLWFSCFPLSSMADFLCPLKSYINTSRDHKSRVSRTLYYIARLPALSSLCLQHLYKYHHHTLNYINLIRNGYTTYIQKFSVYYHDDNYHQHYYKIFFYCYCCCCNST